MLWLGAAGGGFEAPPRNLFKSLPISRRGVGGDTFRSSPIATRPARLAQPTPPKAKPKNERKKRPNPQKQIFCRAELPSKPHPIEKDDYRPPSRNQFRGLIASAVVGGTAETPPPKIASALCCF